MADRATLSPSPNLPVPNREQSKKVHKMAKPFTIHTQTESTSTCCKWGTGMMGCNEVGQAMYSSGATTSGSGSSIGTVESEGPRHAMGATGSKGYAAVSLALPSTTPIKPHRSQLNNKYETEACWSFQQALLARRQRRVGSMRCPILCLAAHTPTQRTNTLLQRS